MSQDHGAASGASTLSHTMPALPNVDVIVSTFNEGAYIGACLEHVLGQDYPADLLHVWLIDGGSTDQTVSTARTWAEKDHRLKVVATGERLNLPEALNVAIRESSSDFVAKIDAHGYPEKTFIRLAVEAAIEDDTLGCVGGRPVQAGETAFGEALAFARRSRVGVGGSEYSGTTERQYVGTVQCGVYRRVALNKVGWFDPAMNFGEDDELNWRVTNGGYRILLDTRIKFHYITRSTWRGAYRQYRNYGRARVMVVRKHPAYLRLYHLIPAGFLLTLATLAIAALFSEPARTILAVIVAVYLFILFLEATRVSRRRPGLIPAIVGAFIALHLGYGIGMIKGMMGLLLAEVRPWFQRQTV